MIELPLWSPILLALSEASICSALLKCLGLCVWIGFINTSQRINFDSSQQTVGRAWISEDKQNQDTTNCWQGDGDSTYFGMQNAILRTFYIHEKYKK